jgi:hypothetical protein
MDKAKILLAAQAALQRHTWGAFVDEGLTIALAVTESLRPGCEACRKRINTNSQYLRHLADDVLPQVIESVLSETIVLSKSETRWQKLLGRQSAIFNGT